MCYQLNGPKTLVDKIKVRIENRALDAGISIDIGTCKSKDYTKYVSKDVMKKENLESYVYDAAVAKPAKAAV